VQSAGAEVRVIDLSPRPGRATFRQRLSRLPKLILGLPRLGRLVFGRKNVAVYVGVNGGLGQVYDALFIAVARLASADLYLHHDSYAYLDRSHRLTDLVVRIAGVHALHIVLCNDMGDRLRDLYPIARHTIVISNVTNTEGPVATPRPRQRLTSIGFMSNLTRAKGVLEFLDVAERVCRARPEIRALLVGPVEEPSLEPILRSRLASAPWVEYLGPLYGEAKSLFLTELDVFVFPTRYVNEAEPKVLAEALAHGVVIIARSRGCIDSLVDASGGIAVPESKDFISTAERLLLDWSATAVEFSTLSAAALRGFHDLRQLHEERLGALIAAMAGAKPIPSTTT